MLGDVIETICQEQSVFASLSLYAKSREQREIYGKNISYCYIPTTYGTLEAQSKEPELNSNAI